LDEFLLLLNTWKFFFLDVHNIQEFEYLLSTHSMEEQQFFSKLKSEVEKANTFFREKMTESQRRFHMLIGQANYLKGESDRVPNVRQFHGTCRIFF
jgi:hypothetical protein